MQGLTTEIVEEHVEKLATVMSEVIKLMNDLESKIYHLEEIVLDGKKAEVNQ